MEKTSKLLNSNHTVKERKWQKPNILRIPFDKDPNKRYRFVRLNDLTTFFNSRDSRGWEVEKVKPGAESNDYNGKFNQFTKKGLDSAYMVGDLILCSMPIQMAEDRNKYYAEASKKKSEAVRQPKEDGNLHPVDFNASGKPAAKTFKPVKGSVYTR